MKYLIVSLMSIVLWHADPAAAADLDKGRRLAKQFCASCHMNKGQGEKQGPMGIPGFAAVANRANQTDGQIVSWLMSKPQMMPDHHLTRQEAEVLAAFIMSLRKGR